MVGVRAGGGIRAGTESGGGERPWCHGRRREPGHSVSRRAGL